MRPHHSSSTSAVWVDGLKPQNLCRLMVLALGWALLTACGGEGSSEGKPQVVFITNGPADFWTVAAAGTIVAERDFDVECDYRTPGQAQVGEQNRILEDLLARGVDGIAISPISGENQTEVLNEAAKRCSLITHDSDAPDSDRLCYIGVDNYVAGRQCGKLVRDAVPDGGKFVIFVGRLEQDNARLRRQGLIDELMGRDNDRTRYDEPGQVIEGNGYTILDTRTDAFDSAKAKANAEDAIAVYPELDGMIGLFGYNPPACLEALKGAGKLGEIKVVAFDEYDATLQGILDGHVVGTIVQQPYQYGYESVRILAGLARGDKSVLPEGGFLEIPAKTIIQDNAQAFWDELKELKASAKE